MPRRRGALLLLGALLLAVTGCHKEMDAREEAERLALRAEQQRQIELQRQQQTGASGTQGSTGSTASTRSTTSSGSAGGATTGSGTGSTGTGTGSGSNSAAAKPIFVPVSLANLGVNETANLGPISYTVTATWLVKQAPAFPQGYGFVLVEIHIKNEGKERYSINSVEHFVLTDKDGKNYKLNAQASGQRSPRLQGILEGGQELQGWLGYLLKVYHGDYTLTIKPSPDWGEATYNFQL